MTFLNDMKNIFLILLTSLFLTACGQTNSTDQKLVGLWTGTTKASKDKDKAKPGTYAAKELKNLMVIEFKENHDVIYPDSPPEHYKDLKYEVTGDKLRIGVGCYLIEKITDNELVLLELDAFCKDNGPLSFRLAFKKSNK